MLFGVECVPLVGGAGVVDVVQVWFLDGGKVICVGV